MWGIKKFCTESIYIFSNLSGIFIFLILGPPRIVISPSKKVFAVIGQRVSLECTGEGDPIPTVQWKYERAPDRGDVPTPVEGALSQGSATLTLNAVSRSDSGNYYCTANNVAGSVTETVQLEGKRQILFSNS